MCKSQIREEVSFTKGRIIVRGKLVKRGKADVAMKDGIDRDAKGRDGSPSRPKLVSPPRLNLNRVGTISPTIRPPGRRVRRTRPT